MTRYWILVSDCAPYITSAGGSAVILWKAGILDMVKILFFVLSPLKTGSSTRIKHPATGIAMPHGEKPVNDYKLVGLRHSFVRAWT